tara:strand:+ start:1740 stop:1922 length:183 start_codon:yes stop_codon:yes gene_type:complete
MINIPANATWTDRKHLNTALKAAIAAIPLDCSGPLVSQLFDQLLALKAANKAAAATNRDS